MQTKVLVVDDTNVIRNAISEYLTGLGHDVDTAGSMADAMELMEAKRYNILITDLYMPDLGYNAENVLFLIKYIKKHIPGIEVIVMSGDPSIETSLSAIKQGAFYFFSKPFALAALKDKINIIKHKQSKTKQTRSHHAMIPQIGSRLPRW